MFSLAEENYLKAIYHIGTSDELEKGVNTNAIADQLQTKAGSVTDMLRKLAEKGLITYEKYKGVKLTEQGRSIALQVVRKHRIWEVFLVEKLGYKWDEVHEIAEQLEHINSASLIEKMDAFLGYPSHDPHGDPIPDKSGKFSKEQFEPLNELKAGQQAVMRGVTAHESAFLQHLEKLGLLPGTRVRLLEKNELDGSILMSVDNRQVPVSDTLAAKILVKPL